MTAQAVLLPAEQRAKIHAKLASGDTANLQQIHNVLQKTIQTQNILMADIVQKNPDFLAQIKGTVRNLKTGDLAAEEAEDRQQALKEMEALEAELESVF